MCLKSIKEKKKMAPYLNQQQNHQGLMLMHIENFINNEKIKEVVFILNNTLGLKKALVTVEQLNISINSKGGYMKHSPLEWDNYKIEGDEIINLNTNECIKMKKKYFIEE